MRGDEGLLNASGKTRGEDGISRLFFEISSLARQYQTLRGLTQHGQERIALRWNEVRFDS